MGANITWDEDVKKREREEKENMKDIEEQKWFGEVIGSQWRAQVLCEEIEASIGRDEAALHIHVQ